MTKQTKTTILIISFAAFFILGYLILSYAYGYKFDFDELKWEKTGGILVKTNLAGVEVSIDNHLKGNTSLISASFVKKNLLPGSYSLELNKDGYPAVSKNIEVNSGQVSQIIHLYLPKKDEIENFIENLISQDGNEPTDYFINKTDGLLYKKSGEKTEKISSEPVYLKDFTLRVFKNTFYLGSKDAKTSGVFVLNDSGKWDSIYSQPTSDLILSPDGKKLAIIGLNQINVLWLEDDNEPPYFRKGHNESVLNIGQEIEKSFWFKTDWHLIYLTVLGETHFLEIDPTGGRNDLMI